jgi:hypothetical protein
MPVLRDAAALPAAPPLEAPPETRPLDLAVRAAPPPPEDPRRAIEAALETLECARVTARFDSARGVAVLSGHVRSGEERAELRRRLDALPAVQRVEDAALQVVGDPYCRVLNLLGRLDLTKSEDQRHDLTEAIGAPARAASARFAAGALLELAMGAPDYPSYVYVSYFASDGRVHHLLAGDDPHGNRFRPDERFQLGGRNGRGRRVTIAPPYGLDLVLALASSEPLMARPRPVTESAAAYVEALQAAIEALRRGGRDPKVEYAYYLIRTTPPGAAP